MSERRRQKPGWSCRSLLVKSLRSEFKPSAFGFDYENPATFALPQWCWMDGIVYNIYRFVVATLLVTWLACEIPYTIHNQSGDRPFIWFTFASNWSFIIFTLTTVGFAGFALFYTLDRSRDERIHGNKVLWFFYNMSINTTLVTSIAYWVAFWEPEYVEFYRLSAKLKHTVPALLVLLDLCLNNIPVRLLHGIYPLCLGAIYALFTYIYWVASYAGYTGNGIIYPAINWNRPHLAVVACLLAICLCLLVQVLLFLIYFLRVFLSYKLGGRGNSDLDHFCPEHADEASLIVNEDAELITKEKPTNHTSPVYSSLN
ncbi:hypothetical protein SprV_0401414800 [Sparganum proliferum]